MHAGCEIPENAGKRPWSKRSPRIAAPTTDTPLAISCLRIAGALAIALITTSAPSRAESGLAATCTLIRDDVGDCACITRFLTARVGDNNAAILLGGWALAAGWLRRWPPRRPSCACATSSRWRARPSREC